VHQTVRRGASLAAVVALLAGPSSALAQENSSVTPAAADPPAVPAPAAQPAQPVAGAAQTQEPPMQQPAPPPAEQPPPPPQEAPPPPDEEPPPAEQPNQRDEDFEYCDPLSGDCPGQGQEPAQEPSPDVTAPPTSGSVSVADSSTSAVAQLPVTGVPTAVLGVIGLTLIAVGATIRRLSRGGSAAVP
jgi:hypothetical protein